MFSSSVIPGNERSIQNLMDMVVRQGAHIIHYRMLDIHAGGHAKAEDLKLIMRLIKPEYFMPIEANHYMLRAHAELAEQVGIPSDKYLWLIMGSFLFQDGRAFSSADQKVPSDCPRLMVGVGDVSEVVLLIVQ